MITQEQIQSIVDGECSHESRVLLLQAMESHPSTWRTLALALLEEQQWSKQISLISKKNASGQIDPATQCNLFEPNSPPKETADLISRTALAAVGCLKTRANADRLILFSENGLNQQSPKASVRAQPLVSVASTEFGHRTDGANKMAAPWLTALAASLLLGIGFYGGSIMPTSSKSEVKNTSAVVSSVKDQSEQVDERTPLGDQIGTDMKMLVSGPNRETSEIPIYDFRALDHDLVIAKEMYEVARINQRLRREGFELDVRPEYYTGKLHDGRQLIVPVKHVGLKPYGL